MIDRKKLWDDFNDWFSTSETRCTCNHCGHFHTGCPSWEDQQEKIIDLVEDRRCWRGADKKWGT